jgi:hypothetical protein
MGAHANAKGKDEEGPTPPSATAAAVASIAALRIGGGRN